MSHLVHDSAYKNDQSRQALEHLYAEVERQGESRLARDIQEVVRVELESLIKKYDDASALTQASWDLVAITFVNILGGFKMIEMGARFGNEAAQGITEQARAENLKNHPQPDVLDGRAYFDWRAGERDFIQERLQEAAEGRQLPSEDRVQFFGNLQLKHEALQKTAKRRDVIEGFIRAVESKDAGLVSGLMKAANDPQFKRLHEIRYQLRRHLPVLQRALTLRSQTLTQADVAFDEVIALLKGAGVPDPAILDVRSAIERLSGLDRRFEAELLRFYQTQIKDNPAVFLLPFLEANEPGMLADFQAYGYNSFALRDGLLPQLEKVSQAAIEIQKFVRKNPAVTVATSGLSFGEELGGYWTEVRQTENMIDGFKHTALTMLAYMLAGGVGEAVGGLAFALAFDGAITARDIHDAYTRFHQLEQMSPQLGVFDTTPVDIQAAQGQRDGQVIMALAGLAFGVAMSVSAHGGTRALVAKDLSAGRVEVNFRGDGGAEVHLPDGRVVEFSPEKVGEVEGRVQDLPPNARPIRAGLDPNQPLPPRSELSGGADALGEGARILAFKPPKKRTPPTPDEAAEQAIPVAAGGEGRVVTDLHAEHQRVNGNHGQQGNVVAFPGARRGDEPRMSGKKDEDGLEETVLLPDDTEPQPGRSADDLDGPTTAVDVAAVHGFGATRGPVRGRFGEAWSAETGEVLGRAEFDVRNTSESPMLSSHGLEIALVKVLEDPIIYFTRGYKDPKLIRFVDEVMENYMIIERSIDDQAVQMNNINFITFKRYYLQLRKVFKENDKLDIPFYQTAMQLLFKKYNQLIDTKTEQATWFSLLSGFCDHIERGFGGSVRGFKLYDDLNTLLLKVRAEIDKAPAKKAGDSPRVVPKQVPKKAPRKRADPDIVIDTEKSLVFKDGTTPDSKPSRKSGDPGEETQGIMLKVGEALGRKVSVDEARRLRAGTNPLRWQLPLGAVVVGGAATYLVIGGEKFGYGPLTPRQRLEDLIENLEGQISSSSFNQSNVEKVLPLFSAGDLYMKFINGLDQNSDDTKLLTQALDDFESKENLPATFKLKYLKSIQALLDRKEKVKNLKGEIGTTPTSYKSYLFGRFKITPAKDVDVVFGITTIGFIVTDYEDYTRFRGSFLNGGSKFRDHQWNSLSKVNKDALLASVPGTGGFSIGDGFYFSRGYGHGTVIHERGHDLDDAGVWLDKDGGLSIFDDLERGEVHKYVDRYLFEQGYGTLRAEYLQYFTEAVTTQDGGVPGDGKTPLDSFNNNYILTERGRSLYNPYYIGIGLKGHIEAYYKTLSNNAENQKKLEEDLKYADQKYAEYVSKAEKVYKNLKAVKYLIENYHLCCENSSQAETTKRILRDRVLGFMRVSDHVDAWDDLIDLIELDIPKAYKEAYRTKLQGKVQKIREKG